ncbi:MAG: nucleoside deaminase [Alphaproteobacteria bacterium]|nr:MAG: nucleoside deaminase [Alphaproteobacteria bacterium]
MQQAITAAKAAAKRGEVPVGAVLVDALTGTVLAAEGNRVEELRDPLAHAEMLVIQAALKQRGDKYLEDCDLYVTLEPCPLCASAISLARLRRVYFGAYDPKSGGTEHGPRIFEHDSCHHKPEVYGGIDESHCGALLTKFFSKKRHATEKDK